MRRRHQELWHWPVSQHPSERRGLTARQHEVSVLESREPSHRQKVEQGKLESPSQIAADN